ncbi:Ferroporti-1 [Akanthomyces lecanii RCEF 1005]|uniref:Solute carrier family 40 member n=1 Tax=Akanthomyces lecanii RCEF 1005 TaxID=1081108 RepID=A0A162LSS7_CORDF|nr:Ferroporti-1 [Akanthomyces lecanii RCEF 1005]
MHSDDENPPPARATDPLLGSSADPRRDVAAASQQEVDVHERRRLESRLYVSHTLSAWNSRLFEFGAVLFLASIFPQTLLPMSLYALVRSLAAVALAHPVGARIDRGHRLRVVRASIVGQRLPVAASCGILWLLAERRAAEASPHVVGVLLALLCALAGVEKVAAMANTIAVERDWVVAMTGEDEGWRRGKTFWPSAGVVYKNVDALQNNHTDPLPAQDAASPSVVTRFRTFMAAIVPISSLMDYFRHSAFLPSFSLSLLYLTVLSFSGQFITFLLSIGFTPLHVGIARTGSTVIELSATWAAPRLMSYMGPIRGGIWSLSWQMICLTLGLGMFLRDGIGTDAHHAWTSVAGLIVCIALSRLGLWGYDLCAQTIVQEEVEDGNRGAFSSVEASFQNLFELLSFATTIAFSRPEQFHWPLIISIAAVYIAGGLYAFFVRHRRGHLFHPPACLKVETER